MTDSRQPRRRAAWLLIAIAIGGVGLAGLWRAAQRRDPVPIPAPQATDARKPLRIESGSTPAPKPLPAARAVVRTAGVAPIPSKDLAPLDDSPEAHATVPPDQRAAVDRKHQVLFGRPELLKERDGSCAFSTRTYGTTIGRGRVDLVVPASRGHAFSYQFTELRAGAVVLASGGEARAVAHPEDRAVSYDRGPVEERYLLRPDALEQTFVVRSLPAGRGALTVSGRVSTDLTPPANGTSGPALAFASKGREVLSISHAVAVDAGGRRQDLQLAYADGILTMTVPAEWVAAASLPITIDPLMGGAITADASVAAVAADVQGVPVRVTDVAYNAADNEWLVVWQEQFGAGAFNVDVYAQRVSATGALVGGVIPVAASAAGEVEPAVSWAPDVNRYLVSWRHDPADDASDADQVIAGVVLGADGSVFAAPFTLDDAPGQDFGPSLLFDGTQWLCVFTNVVSATDTNALGRFVGLDGVPGAAITLDADADLAAAPSVDVVGTTYLAAWQKGVAGGPRSIVARTMDATGAFLTPLTAVDKSANDCIHPDVSSGGGAFLVVWQQSAPPTDNNVVGRLATTALTFPKNPFNVRAGVNNQLTPRAAFAPAANFWYVVYSDTTAAAVTNIFGSRVDTTGKAFGGNKLTSNVAAEFKPEIAWNPVTNEMLVAFLQGDASPFQIVAQRVSMDFTAPTVPGTPVVAPNPHPTGTFVVTWAPTVEAGGSGFSNYDLQRSANGGAKWTVVASPTTESFADSLPHGAYLYRVRASDNAGNNSAYSAAATVVVDPAPPAEPLAAGQARADGVTPIPVGGSSPDSTVVLGAVGHDLGLLDGFEDANFTVDPMWVAATGTWSIVTDGFKALQDGNDLDNVIHTATGAQAYGSWEYRFRFATISNGANLQAGFYLFLDTAGLGGNGYQALVTAGTASTRTVSLHRVEGAVTTRIIGADLNWTPDTAFHVLRVNRAANGLFELYFDGALVGSATDTLYATAASTALRHTSSNTNKLRVDYLRTSSSPVARSNVKLQVEVKPLGMPFDGAGLVESAFVASGTAVSVPVPAPVGSYHWRSRAVDELGNAGPFASFGANAETDADFTVIPAAPPPPPSALMAAAGDAQVVLTWGASAGATSYTVKRSLVHGGPYTPVVTGVTALTHPDTGLQNGTPYYYIVTAVGPGGESAPSNQATATPQGVPAAPTALQATGGSNQVLLSWTASIAASTYIVKRATQTGGPYGTLATGVVPTTYTDNAVVNGTPYYYVVAAQNTAGISGDSNEASATPATPLPAPANLAGVALSMTSIQWTWSDVEGENGYRLHDDAHATLASTGADVVTATESGLTENTSYSRHVHGLFGAVLGGASPTRSRATHVHDALAADFVVTRPASAHLRVTVTPPPNGTLGNTGVQIERSTDGGPWVVIKPFSKVYVLQDLGLSPTAAYSYRIRFQNADGIASQTSPAQSAPAATPPAAPAGFTVTPELTTMLRLAWTNVPDNLGYEIHDENHAVQGTTGPHITSLLKVGLTENTPYSFHVHALGAAGPGAASNTVVAHTGIHPPVSSDFNISLQQPTEVLVTVVPPPNPASGVTGCEIERWTSNSGWAVIKPFSPVYSFTDVSLPQGTFLQYRFRYQNGSGVPTATSPTRNLSTPSSGIAAPGNFNGAVQSTSSILWTWNTVSGVTGYLLRSDAGIIATLGPAEVSYLETGLAENTAYSRFILAQSGSALSPSSLRSTKTTFIRDATLADFTVTATSMSSIDLTFTPPPNAAVGSTAVRLERSTDGTNWALIPTMPGLYLISETGLLGNTTYHYRFSYVNGAGVAAGTSPSRSATTLEATVGPVAGLTAALGGGGVSLQWTPNTEPALVGYNVYRSTQSGGPYSKRNGSLVVAAAYVDTGISPTTTYHYVVRAVATGGAEGANSNQASITTGALPPVVTLGYIRGLSSTSIGAQTFPSFFGIYSFELHDNDHNVKAVRPPAFVDPESPPMIVETGLSENTSYTRHVHTIKDGASSGPSGTATGYTLVHDALSADFSLEWLLATNSVKITVVPPPNSTSASTGVRIERWTGSFFGQIAQLTGTYTFTDPGRTPGVTYRYRIVYLNGQGDSSAPSPEKSIVSPPGIVASFSGLSQTPDSIFWSWSSADGALQYFFHDGDHASLATLTALTHLESGLQENTRYNRHVHAETSQGTGGPSPTAEVFTLVHDPADPDFTATVLPNSDVRIVVTAPPNSTLGSTGCEIQRLLGGAWIVVKPFSATYTFVESGLPSSTTQSYRIRFRNGDAVATAPSPQKDVLTGPPPAPAPTGLAGIALTPFSIQWSWDNFAGSDGFELHDAAHNIIGTTGAGELSFTETGLSENVQVTRHLHALNGFWTSAPSGPVSRYTLIHDALGADLVFAPLSEDAIDVQVVPPPQASAGLTGCLIERSSNGVDWIPVKPFSNVYGVLDTGLMRDTSYFYRVTFRNGDGIAGLASPVQTSSTLSIGRPVITTAPKKTRNQNTGVQGTAEPGSTVIVLFNGVPDGTTVAAGGVWSYSATTKNEGGYLVTARASLGGQTTGDSSGIAITVDLTPPDAPTRIRATGFSNIIDVEWDPSTAPDLAGYLIYRKEVGAQNWGLLNPTQVVRGAKYRDITAQNGHRYAFKVVAVDDARND